MADLTPKPSAPPTLRGQPLAQVPPGQQVVVTGYDGGLKLQSRLMAMGLVVGQVLSVIQNNAGMMIVGLNGGRVALGRGMSRKILVAPAPPPG